MTTEELDVGDQPEPHRDKCRGRQPAAPFRLLAKNL